MKKDQKVFLVNRIVAIHQKAFNAIQTISKDKATAWTVAGTPETADIHAAIQAGTLPLLPTPTGMAIGGIFDLTVLIADALLIQDGLVKPNRTNLYLRNPSAKYSDTQGTFYFPEDIARATAINASLQAALDEAMLGSDVEALAALKTLESMEF